MYRLLSIANRGYAWWGHMKRFDAGVKPFLPPGPTTFKRPLQVDNANTIIFNNTLPACGFVSPAHDPENNISRRFKKTHLYLILCPGA